ncbi:MAG: SLC13 family permease [Acidobacteriota bacterium]
MAIAIVLVLTGLVILNFALELMANEVFALIVMVTLVVCGILPVDRAFMGFANSAILMIAGIMILTGGIIHNGAADYIGRTIQRIAGNSERRTNAYLLGFVNVISAVINNVAATAMFIPVAEGLARRLRVNRSRYLLPIAFASMMGGMCTLFGTSTNVAVSGALRDHGLLPLGLFELTPLGVIVSIVGFLYLSLVAPRLLGRPPEKGPVDAYGIKGFVFEVIVGEGSALVGKTIEQSRVGQTLGVNVLAIERGEQRIISPLGSDRILAGDLLLVEGARDAMPAIQATRGLEIKHLPALRRADLESDRVRLVEATISYNSPFIGKTLKELNFRHRFDLGVLAIHRRGEVVVDKVGRIRLRAGDVLLIHGQVEMFDRLGQEPTMLLLESVVLPKYNPRRAVRALLIFAAAVAAILLGWLDAPTAFLAGGALVMALKCLPPDEAGSYLNVRFLVMLAGMVSLGMAMESSGAARLLADAVVSLLPSGEPRLLLAVFFLLTALLTQALSNAAAALLILPIALHAAVAAAVDPRSFGVTVAIAASSSFITPLEPACLLVYSTGRYRFRDFVRVGTLLTLVVFAVTMVLVPRLWPLRP